MALAEVLIEIPSLVCTNYKVQFTAQGSFLIIEGMSFPNMLKEAVQVLNSLFNMVCKVLKVQWAVLKEGKPTSPSSGV